MMYIHYPVRRLLLNPTPSVAINMRKNFPQRKETSPHSAFPLLPVPDVCTCVLGFGSSYASGMRDGVFCLRHSAPTRLDHLLYPELPLSQLFHKQGWVEGIVLVVAALPRPPVIIRMAGLALA